MTLSHAYAVAGERRDTLNMWQIENITRVIDTLVPCSLVSTIHCEDDTDRLEDNLDHHSMVEFSKPYYRKVVDTIEINGDGYFF